MNLKFVDYMLALDEEKSITAAAKRLHITQPAMSSFLIAMEQEAGGRLFLRKKNHLEATALGRVYLDSFRQMAAIRNHMDQAILTISGQKTEKIVIGATPNRGSHTLSTIYPHFISRYPNVKFEVVETYADHLIQNLLSGETDIILANSIEPEVAENKNLFRIDIAKEDVVLCVHRSSPLAACGTAMEGREYPVITPGQLRGIPIVLIKSGATRKVADRFLGRGDFTPTIVAESQNFNYISYLLQEGAGAGFITPYYLRGMKNISTFSLEPNFATYQCIMYCKGRELKDYERFFIDLLIEYVPKISSGMIME